MSTAVNKDRLDDIDEKGGTRTVRQKIYQEHSDAMVELEKQKMKGEFIGRLIMPPMRQGMTNHFQIKQIGTRGKDF